MSAVEVEVVHLPVALIDEGRASGAGGVCGNSQKRGAKEDYSHP